MNCNRHRKRKDPFYCINRECQNRLECDKCYQETYDINEHKHIYIKGIVSGNK